MAHDLPAAPKDGGGEKAGPPAAGRNDSDAAGRVQESIQRLSESRLRAEGSIEDLGKRAESLRAQMTAIIGEEKAARIDRGRLSSRRDTLRAQVTELRRERLEKQTGLSAARVALREERQLVSEKRLTEAERLAHRVEDLREEVAAFKETLRMHRRDRDRTSDALLKAYGDLQDLLTEQLLWKIVALQSEEGDKGKSERSGKAGLMAELLGRLLVLEKEGAQISGLLPQLGREDDSGGLRKVARSG